jgi:ketosteroid isomerase-like protein
VGANSAGVEVVRRFYQAVAEVDIEAALDCFAPPVWVLPGRSRIAGRHEGRDAIRHDFLALLDPLSGGTLRAATSPSGSGTTLTRRRSTRRASLSGSRIWF